jgi:hypothetical protein
LYSTAPITPVINPIKAYMKGIRIAMTMPTDAGKAALGAPYAFGIALMMNENIRKNGTKISDIKP